MLNLKFCVIDENNFIISYWGPFTTSLKVNHLGNSFTIGQNSFYICLPKIIYQNKILIKRKLKCAKSITRRNLMLIFCLATHFPWQRRNYQVWEFSNVLRIKNWYQRMEFVPSNGCYSTNFSIAKRNHITVTQGRCLGG